MSLPLDIPETLFELLEEPFVGKGRVKAWLSWGWAACLDGSFQLVHILVRIDLEKIRRTWSTTTMRVTSSIF